MPKPVCVKCQRFFRLKRGGVYLLEQMPVGGAGEVPPGTTEPEAWKPYKIWNADLHQCPGCKTEIISGYGFNPISIQHEEDFHKYLQLVTHTVNDC